MNQLKAFYDNFVERDAVKEFLIDCLKEMAVERAFEGKGVVGISEANETINKAFEILEIKYGIIKKEIINNSR